MKNNRYLVSVVETAKEHAGAVKLSATTALMVMGPAISSFAADSNAGTSLLDGEVLASVQGGFTNLVATITQVVGLAALAGISVVGLTVAVKYAIKKIKGMASAAA